MRHGSWPGRGAAIALITGFLLVLPSMAQDGAFSVCIEEAVRQDLAAKIAFQRGTRDLVVRDKPEFEALANLNMELQVALAQARAAKYAYLLRHDPARIETADGSSAFRNFDWSDADEAAFAQQNAQYREMKEKVARLRDENDGHPDWPALRERMRVGLMQSREFKALMARLFEGYSALGTFVRGCRAE